MAADPVELTAPGATAATTSIEGRRTGNEDPVEAVYESGIEGCNAYDGI